MVIIKAQGGLGNQMFQYALYRVLELKQDNIKMDINSTTLNLHTGFELERVFNLKINYSSYSESFRMINDKYINELKNGWAYNYESDVMEIDDGYLDGYWQHEEYFKSIRHELLKKYKFNNVSGIEVENMIYNIENNESVSIHIRRGDYTNSSIYDNVATLEYYEEAIKIIKSKVVNPVFFIFSDDIEWVEKNIKINKSYIINFNTGLDSYKDMFLMSRCKHNIIANSTFSWWGAWLNTNLNKIVVRPEKFTNIEIDGSTICDVKGWIKCGSKTEKEKIAIDDSKFDYLEEAKYSFLNDLFIKGKYDVIKKLYESTN
ncbi:alpha-1,2-fucosyltransferase, partial [Clostridium butyricum]